MKHFLLAISLALGFSTAVLAADAAKPETVKVCVDVQGKDGKPVIDPKTKKPKQDCKEIKKHKKHEGTKVPEKK
jgi:opacity protein-like surface antigen